ncbi:MAG: hypothetical protein IKF52_04420 [Clostridia bacterium]|nr:hypothetical protein [Clostridia bacterium]
MSNDMLGKLILIVLGAFAAIVVVYLILNKKMRKNTKFVASLTEGTKVKKHSMEITYQKLYVRFIEIPFLRRYVLKVRRRLEIINLGDEYRTRRDTAQMISKALITVLPITIGIIVLTKSNFLLMATLLIFEIFFIETLLSGYVDKKDNELLKQQINMFAEMRHAFHEYNLVEEAVYEVAQNDEVEVSRQAEKIYEILISDDPEMELEKYYDIAPNSYLKEFAGISYLTKEFGDRTDKDGASLYLKNLNNITQEMQIEILKRDKLDYVFQSLSLIACLPILFIQPIKTWAIKEFGFTKSFYNGKTGFILQVLLVIITAICYVLVRKLKDNGSVNTERDMQNPWEQKLYKKPIIKQFINMIVPKKGTRDYRLKIKLMKDSATKLKMEWLYVDRVVCAIGVFIVALFCFYQLHKITLDYIYNEPDDDYNLMGTMSEKDERKALKVLEVHNVYLNKYKNNRKVTVNDIQADLEKDDFYKTATDDERKEAAEKIYDKLKTIQNEYVKWFELLLAFAFAGVAYFGPVWLLMFQAKMRQLEMENEVMEFQTIILMLMKIERVSVEMILEWLERYSNIFRDPISRCVNNFESGPWEALEELKNDITFAQLIRIVEGLQSAVEKIPIRQAFDELDTERAYYQEKRKESNERLIKRKALIGKVIGFAPMICLFVGYLIIPLCYIGLKSMVTAFSSMGTMM